MTSALTPDQVRDHLNQIAALTAQLQAHMDALASDMPSASPTAVPCPTKADAVAIYVDGASQYSGGGWGVVVYIHGEVAIERGGYEEETTNNRMELQAAIEACKLITELGLHELGEKVPVYSDSQYVVKGITLWIQGWKRNGWRSSSGDVKNPDLWQELDALNLPVIKWQWVKGHNGNRGNERADTIAQGFACGKPVPLVNNLG